MRLNYRPLIIFIIFFISTPSSNLISALLQIGQTGKSSLLRHINRQIGHLYFGYILNPSP
ncbi:hypothetical protein ES708_35199 [subsurface metagenome]